jgi:hypothetical protein
MYSVVEFYKTPIFRNKLAKFAENRDRNIDGGYLVIIVLGDLLIMAEEEAIPASSAIVLEPPRPENWNRGRFFKILSWGRGVLSIMKNQLFSLRETAM